MWEGGGIDMPFKLSTLWEVRGKGAITIFKLWNIKETSEILHLQVLPKKWFIDALMLKRIQ